MEIIGICPGKKKIKTSGNKAACRCSAAFFYKRNSRWANGKIAKSPEI
jgi:hypothetical protein